MKTCILIKDARQVLKNFTDGKRSIGFVPTMGALHEGHMSLIRESKKANDITVCSIFVNPMQFNNPDDLSGYPRMLGQDSNMLMKEGVDILFAPGVDEIYPPGEKQVFEMDFGRLDKVLEGKYRPGHFTGVAIVVKKLFDIIRPSRAYFGKKDFQQLTIIRKMVETFRMPVEIIPCETVREADGLAMSSRNLRLTIAERQLATRIYDVLMFTRANAGSIPVRKLQQLAQKRLADIPEFRIDYFEIIDKQTLLPVHAWDRLEDIIACTAVYLGDVRLIDNMELFS